MEMIRSFPFVTKDVGLCRDAAGLGRGPQLVSDLGWSTARPRYGGTGRSLAGRINEPEVIDPSEILPSFRGWFSQSIPGKPVPLFFRNRWVPNHPFDRSKPCFSRASAFSQARRKTAEFVGFS